MKHLSDDELEQMIEETEKDLIKIRRKIDPGYRRIRWLALKGGGILLPFWRWRQARLYQIDDNLSAGLRALNREARARSLRGYKGKGK